MELEKITELIKQNLISLENLQTEIKKLQTKNFAEGQAKEMLIEMLSPAINCLLDTYDFIVELESCIDETDLRNFLELMKIN